MWFQILLLTLISVCSGKEQTIKWTKLYAATRVDAPRSPGLEHSHHYSVADLQVIVKAWKLFRFSHPRDYTYDDEEKERLLIFAENFRRVHRHNELYEQKRVSYRTAINKFSDMTSTEIQRYKGLRIPKSLKSDPITHQQVIRDPDWPSSLDWREKGAVTGVKDQGHCGSCWAFSTTGAVEGREFVKQKRLVSLSEQQLVDCSSDYKNQACQGGIMDYAFDYIVHSGGLDTEDTYPYVSGTTGEAHDHCLYNKSTVAARLSGFRDVPRTDETALMKAIQGGPVAIAINAALPSFMHYKSGVYSDPDCDGGAESLDHGVLLVGYGEDEEGIPYWLVKNSWSEHWGEGGYIKILRKGDNLCGVATMASYPIIADDKP